MNLRYVVRSIAVATGCIVATALAVAQIQTTGAPGSPDATIDHRRPLPAGAAGSRSRARST